MERVYSPLLEHLGIPSQTQILPGNHMDVMDGPDIQLLYWISRWTQQYTEGQFPALNKLAIPSQPQILPDYHTDVRDRPDIRLQ